jgi:enediyne polyketide synthase
MPVPPTVAILSLACRFPDAASPESLWTNVLDGRRSFRALPPERLDLARYAAELVGEADSITPIHAALLTNWSFDRDHFRIPKHSFESTDPTHWLALELAARAIAAIGGPGILDRSRTAVVVANTLAGEVSRSSLLRLRAPFLDTVLARSARQAGLAPEAGERLRRDFASELRRHFPDPNEESLAGGLANTIAGRIANYFDLHGGAYSVDGACASSLVAIADAANLIVSGQVDTVIVGAVDLSLDPFELVGFSRNGALARDEMRVFDARSNGFWPGEGGGFAVLMREEQAKAGDLPIMVRLRGWGMSTDGAGGLTRPSAAGQLLASQRAYEMAGVDPDDIAFVEAHGTGTEVGDPIELRALALLRQGARNSLPVGSIKANIGHTKAAAGFAGLIKAAMALQHGIVPPHIGCSRPHPVFRELDHRVRPALTPEGIGGRRVAGVSSFGFGGVNAHIVIEAARSTAPVLSLSTPKAPDIEFFPFAGEKDEVLQAIALIENCARSMSLSDLADASAYLGRRCGRGPVRVAVLASRPHLLAARLARARAAIASDQYDSAIEEGVFVGRAGAAPRIGFVFPGQASPSRPDGGLWPHCFEAAAAIRRGLPVDAEMDVVAAPIAQPAIMAADLAGLALLERLGVRATVAVGHSLGEIAALAWAGALDPDQALELARRRGEITARDATSGGTMLRVALPTVQAAALCDPEVVVACENGPADTVLAGPRNAIERVALRCEANGVEVTRMSVSHAFHSADMAAAIAPLRDVLRTIEWMPPQGVVVSTVTGSVTDAGTDLSDLLARQLVAPVRFDAALTQASHAVDFFVEVGPGHGLSRLIRNRGLSSCSIDAFGSSLLPLFIALAELHVRGCDLDFEPLYTERAIHPFDPSVPVFLTNPCGVDHEATPHQVVTAPPLAAAVEEAIVISGDDPLAVILAAIGAETWLPAENIGIDDRFLDKLHLNSLAVSRIVRASARALGMRAPSAPTEFANATPRLLCDALRELGELAREPVEQRIGGVRPWAATYAMHWQEARSTSAARPELTDWSIVRIGDEEADAEMPASPDGRLIWLAAPFTRPVAEKLIALAAQAARDGFSRLAIAHDDAPVAAFARSLASEGAFKSVRVIEGLDPRMAADQVVAALARGGGRYWECRLGEDGGLATPVFAPVVPVCDRSAQITPEDVAVVVGGGRGIAAECALSLGRSGAAIILVGRSKAQDPEVVRTLARADSAGLRCAYVSADVADVVQLAAAVATAAEAFGPPTLLLHAAGINEPMRLGAIDGEAARRCLIPKMDGLGNAIAACGPRLRRIISFGSLIGAIGLEGESHYALANAALTAATQRWAQAGPGRSALALEWSVWAGAGMAERLGTVERLSLSGVDAISVDHALDTFEHLIRRGACGTVAVTGRFGPPHDLDLGDARLPSLRFVDRLLLHFPGQEIVVETGLSLGRDPYLDDHAVDGQLIFPGTMALEAMAQLASCLCELGPVVAIDDVAFNRAITIERGGEARVRLAALRSDQGVEVVLLTAEDEFAAPAVRATFGSARSMEANADLADFPAELSADGAGVAAEALYGPLLFNAGRFRRLDRFMLATSREVVARFAAADGQAWFSAYDPQGFALWDPGLADACLHALQVAVPHRRVLPISVNRIEILQEGIAAQVSAVERDAAHGTYVFDIAVQDRQGRCLQRWSGATFRAVGDLDIAPTLAAEPRIATAYLERLAREAFGDDSIKVALIADRESPREQRRTAALAALGVHDRLDRRADGKLIRRDGTGFVSLAHCNGLTIAVSAHENIGCDLEHADGSLYSRGFVAMEACRKLGRRIDVDRVEAVPCGLPVQVDGMTLLTLDLPDGSGMNTVAFSRNAGARAPSGPARSGGSAAVAGLTVQT